MAAGTPKTLDYRNVPMAVDRRGLATAIVGGFLAIGRESGVRDVIDAQSGADGTGSLAGEPAAARLSTSFRTTGWRTHTVARRHRQLVGNPRGPLATLDAVVDPAASDGAAIALVAGDQGIKVDIRSELDEARAKAQPGFFAAFPAFEPTLSARCRPIAGVRGIADPGHALVSLLAQASADQPGLAAGVAALVQARQAARQGRPGDGAAAVARP